MTTVSYVEVELDGWTADGYDWFAGTLDFGKEVSIAVGAVDERALRFVGRVSGIDGRFRNGGGTTVTFLLEDAMSLLRSTRRTRSPSARWSGPRPSWRCATWRMPSS